MQSFVVERISAYIVGAYGFRTKLDLGVNDRWNRRILCARHLLTGLLLILGRPA